MTNIATLTMNPALDVAYRVKRLDHSRKMRASDQRCDPGGGGINVARVIVRLGDNARCIYLSGGATGDAFDGLLDLHQLVRARVPIAGSTRISTAILEQESGREFRISSPGPEVSQAEWQECLDLLAKAKCNYLVASGTLPPGVPDDFYARVADMAQRRNIRFVLDTSGPALKEGLTAGGIFLAKPSMSEFRDLVGAELTDEAEIAEAAVMIVNRGGAENLIVSMGDQGAFLASSSGSLRLPAIAVETRSSVGAGDSFVAAMVHAFALGWEVNEAFRFGMAAGAAAVLTPGTGLCRRTDVYRLFEETAPSG
ncbi:1-phosphofructokinase family hexose kinase [Altererythrobacter sp. ZODW24]|uniref:1-phosphofructokinase family hexose kinase n=1 Tax=Altererythrobacter sp. ZODW24 TaxID=2185142 RepID=UPI000DF8422B|nr:1-phosphofructokinase family hexose kinase [Altererythrobacter sp. ZODW24]